MLSYEGDNASGLWPCTAHAVHKETRLFASVDEHHSHGKSWLVGFWFDMKRTGSQKSLVAVRVVTIGICDAVCAAHLVINCVSASVEQQFVVYLRPYLPNEFVSITTAFGELSSYLTVLELFCLL